MNQATNNNQINTTHIFEGAVFSDGEDTMRILNVRDTAVYGCSNEFDFQRETKQQAVDALTKWGFKYLGAE